MNAKLQKLLIYSPSKQCQKCYIEFSRIHIIDKVNQHFLCAALAQIVNQK